MRFTSRQIHNNFACKYLLNQPLTSAENIPLTSAEIENMFILFIDLFDFFDLLVVLFRSTYLDHLKCCKKMTSAENSVNFQ